MGGIPVPDVQFNNSETPNSPDNNTDTRLGKASDVHSAATISASKFQPVAIARSTSQPGTITVNISLLQTSPSNKQSATGKNCDETVVCEVSCEQGNEAIPTCDLGIGTHDHSTCSEKFTNDCYKVVTEACNEEDCGMDNQVPEIQCQEMKKNDRERHCCNAASKKHHIKLNELNQAKCHKECCEVVHQDAPVFSKGKCDSDVIYDDVCDVVESYRRSKKPSCSLRTRRSANPDPKESLNKMIVRSQMTPSWKLRTPDPALMKIDEATDAESPGLYQGRMGKISRFSEVYMGPEETAEARSHKITGNSKSHIQEMYSVVGCLFQQLSEAADMIPYRDFSLCGSVLNLMQMFQEKFVNMLKCLRYSPYEEEMFSLNCSLDNLLEELEIQPAFVLVRMIEFGYFLYEIGRLINEEFIPPCFVVLIHKIQTRLYRLRSGRVIRQIFFVPDTYDPIVSTYYKSRQILRIENFCRCKVVLLPPEDPRAIDCPMNWRCLEVNFDEQHGRYLAFKKLLYEACPVPSSRPILSIATVFRRLNGSEGQMSLEELCNFEVSRPRVSMQTITNDIRSRSGLASLPRLRISEH